MDKQTARKQLNDYETRKRQSGMIPVKTYVPAEYRDRLLLVAKWMRDTKNG